ncbi:methyltransferase domain-containing protein [Rhodopseudomonas sp. P2A-2r]|uniref:methyltransferase domain-containing protein n=1 Tax=unclassified Rhodopseudomonas TaxID=2638247 RepID=UPI0022343425|nr:methyltransferase domain-containing protein [Rhodopseudomonas sp. P2A-2r]UZE49189.1 methyltransferase domain-containing protein [Rhodopseudomonas sp. P2A-2r]
MLNNPTSTISADDSQDLSDITCCPRCRSPIAFQGAQSRCSNAECEYARAGFPMVDGQQVLIDFEASIFERATYHNHSGSVLDRDVQNHSIGSRLHRFTFGKNPVADANCRSFIALAKSRSARPLILVIGGAKVGLGAGPLYDDPALNVVGTDVFSSPYTTLVADAHRLPFVDQSFDGVWIQAVLEHVLDPINVVSEIHRVLRKDGLVYAETPFMQQVHERAYDFTRYTQSGHRWLFKSFTEISAGPVTGGGVALLWSIRYLVRAFGVGDGVSRLAALPFFWVRFFDGFGSRRAKADAASGLFFLGRRSEQDLEPGSMPQYYDRQNRAGN